MTPPKRKLIEVALPLEAINREAAREKSIRHGHPSTLHLWWARRPLAAARAVLFASLVDDPSARPEEFPTPEAQEAERRRLFDLIERLVKWENSSNAEILAEAKAEIAKSTGNNPPPVLDPFAGGGTIPLEAQRLGLEAHASDLNPVAVLINKALIEIPPRFAGQPPINPAYSKKARPSDVWVGAKGLAEDVRYYGQWMRDEAQKRIGHLYPKAKLPEGGEATVIAWLWTRTVQCPNPACGCQMPLVRSWILSSKPGKEHYVEPVVNRNVQPPAVGFTVQKGKLEAKEGTVGRRGAKCIACNMPVSLDYIRSEGRAKRLDDQLMAIVAEGNRSRIYIDPTIDQAEISASARPQWAPNTDLSTHPQYMATPRYGLTKHSDLFTNRQLLALSTFSSLISEVIAEATQDAQRSGLPADQIHTYSNSIGVYLAFALSRSSDYWSSITTWHSGAKMEALRNTFTRQAIPITWDFAEGNPFSASSGNWLSNLDWGVKVLDGLITTHHGQVRLQNATQIEPCTPSPLISTDPPYYDNVPYADLSDFFYVWLRKSIHDTYPQLFETVLVPKFGELVADQFRLEGKEKARDYFEKGMLNVFTRFCKIANPDFPVSVYYAFKQIESEEDSIEQEEHGEKETVSTGWETMLSGLIESGFQITGTWPLRSEMANRMRSLDSNALASSIVLVCRPRLISAPIATRRELLQALRSELPTALRELQQGNIAPVDLAQAAIGPGMAVYSRYSRVLESDGTPMRVRTALALINQMLDEVLAEQEGDFDADTRWALAWFEQSGFAEGEFGVAETLSKAKNTSIRGLEEAGILRAKAGKVRLLRPDELPEGWNPAADADIPVWESTHHLIRALSSGGEEAAARLLAALPNGDTARELAYRLYAVCERKRWAQEGLAYNALVTSWLEVSRLAQGVGQLKGPVQDALI